MITADESDAVERIHLHHAVLLQQYELLQANMIEAADHSGAGIARDILVDWCQMVLLPHGEVEEAALRAAVGDEPRPLAEVIRAEHERIAELVRELSEAEDGAHRKAAARVLGSVVAAHLHKESDELIPALIKASRLSHTDLVDGIDKIVRTAGMPTEPKES